MKTKTKILMVLMVILLTSGFGKDLISNLPENDPLAIDANAGFRLVKNQDEILLYTRWITLDETASARQVKTEFVVDCPAKNVVSLLCNEKTYLQWMKSTRAYYRLKTIDPNQWYAYVQFSIPWPLNNQDCILKYEVRNLAEPERTVIIMNSEPDFIKPCKGIERITHMEGSWVITQLGGGKTRVEYFMFSKQKPKFPNWLTDPIVQKNLLKTMDALRVAALKNPN